jgi:hypothetical protein
MSKVEKDQTRSEEGRAEALSTARNATGAHRPLVGGTVASRVWRKAKHFQKQNAPRGLPWRRQESEHLLWEITLAMSTPLEIAEIKYMHINAFVYTKCKYVSTSVIGQ